MMQNRRDAVLEVVRTVGVLVAVLVAFGIANRAETLRAGEAATLAIAGVTIGTGVLALATLARRKSRAAPVIGPRASGRQPIVAPVISADRLMSRMTLGLRDQKPDLAGELASKRTVASILEEVEARSTAGRTAGTKAPARSGRSNYRPGKPPR